MAMMYLKGMCAEEIAGAVGLDLETVNRELERRREEWRSPWDLNEMRGQELMRLTMIEEQAWNTWERLRDAAAESGEETAENREKAEREVNRNQSRYLDLVLKCSVQRRKLLGLDVPAENPETRTRKEHRERMLRMLSTVRQRAGAGVDAAQARTVEAGRGDVRDATMKEEHGQRIRENVESEERRADGRDRRRSAGVGEMEGEVGEVIKVVRQFEVGPSASVNIYEADPERES